MIRKAWQWLNSLAGSEGKRNFFLTAGGFILSSTALTVLILWIGTLNFSFHRLLYYFGEPLMVLLNYLPVAAVMLIVYLLCNRLWIAFLSTSTFFYIFAFTNHFKVQFRGEPFVAMDLATMAEGINAGGEFSFVFPGAFWVGVLCIILGTIVLAFLAKWRIPKKLWYLRPILAVISLIPFQLLWKPYYGNEVRYVGFFVNDYTVFDDWKETERASKRGIIYSFIYSITDTIVQEPPTYDPRMAIDILAQYETEPIPEDRRINVQIHMLETFADLSKLGITFQKDPYECWHRLE